jgi:hypothetical protein
VKLFFCQREPGSAQFCAELGGTKDTQKRTRQMADMLLIGEGPTGAFSERDVKEFHVHPDELKSLPVGRAYLVKHGARAIIQVPYRPDREGVPFAPTIPRRWDEGDAHRFGRGEPALTLVKLMAEKLKKGEQTVRNEPEVHLKRRESR